MNETLVVDFKHLEACSIIGVTTAGCVEAVTKPAAKLHVQQRGWTGTARMSLSCTRVRVRPKLYRSQGARGPLQARYAPGAWCLHLGMGGRW